MKETLEINCKVGRARDDKKVVISWKSWINWFSSNRNDASHWIITSTLFKYGDHTQYIVILYWNENNEIMLSCI